MARGAEAKLRRRNRKKEDAEKADQAFGEAAADNAADEDAVGTSDFGAVPLPPGMNGDSDNAEEVTEMFPKKKKKKKPRGAANPAQQQQQQALPKKEGIKTLPLIFLILMTATTVLPAFIYGADYLSAFLAKNDIAGQIGFRMGIGAVPRKRVVSFYEKHDPNKLDDVATVLSKYYGDYPVLVKKLERKYQDYGYFLGWEDDEAPMRLAMEQIQATYELWLTNYWNRYAPQPAKTGVRNIRYNLTFLFKRGKKMWKKHVWPMLEPLLGVPDEKTAKKQKRKDAEEARKARPGAAKGTRRKNKDFRDDEDED